MLTATGKIGRVRGTVRLRLLGSIWGTAERAAPMAGAFCKCTDHNRFHAKNRPGIVPGVVRQPGLHCSGREHKTAGLATRPCGDSNVRRRALTFRRAAFRVRRHVADCAINRRTRQVRVLNGRVAYAAHVPSRVLRASKNRCADRRLAFRASPLGVRKRGLNNLCREAAAVVLLFRPCAH